MSIIRTEEQADALEILKSIIETADFYRAMGELLTQEKVDHPLVDIAKEREAYIAPFRKVLADLHELPATPDSDKEWIDELSGKITQLLAGDSTQALYDRCLKKDEVLTGLINNTDLGEQSTDFKKLLDSLDEHLIHTKNRLSNIK